MTDLPRDDDFEDIDDLPVEGEFFIDEQPGWDLAGWQALGLQG